MFLLISCIFCIFLFFFNNKQIKQLKFIIFFFIILFFFILSYILFFYNSNTFCIQHFFFFNSIPIFQISVDGLSLIFLTLTAFFFPFIFLSIWFFIKKMKILILLIFFLEIFLFIVFSTIDLFNFYIFFELILIPMIFIIGLWGSRFRKIKAIFYFFLYTFFGSLLLLILISILSFFFGNTNFFFFFTTKWFEWIEQILWLLLFFPFAIKIPLFPLHLWLLEAHVEAPTFGSVILASLLLKLGTYGFLKYLLPLFCWSSGYFAPLILLISFLSLLYSSVILLCQLDTKKIIAYTSIAHMSYAVIGLFSFNLISLNGGLLLSVSHAFTSGALFFLVGFLYERFQTRLVNYFSGLNVIIPIFCFFFFFFSLANFGFPITANFIGESLIFLNFFFFTKKLIFLLIFGLLFSLIYSMLLYVKLFFGEIMIKYIKFKNYNDFTLLEFAIILPLCFYNLFFFFYSYYLCLVMKYNLFTIGLNFCMYINLKNNYKIFLKKINNFFYYLFLIFMGIIITIMSPIMFLFLIINSPLLNLYYFWMKYKFNLKNNKILLILLLLFLIFIPFCLYHVYYDYYLVIIQQNTTNELSENLNNDNLKNIKDIINIPDQLNKETINNNNNNVKPLLLNKETINNNNDNVKPLLLNKETINNNLKPLNINEKIIKLQQQELIENSRFFSSTAQKNLNTISVEINHKKEGGSLLLQNEEISNNSLSNSLSSSSNDGSLLVDREKLRNFLNQYLPTPGEYEREWQKIYDQQVATFVNKQQQQLQKAEEIFSTTHEQFEEMYKDEPECKQTFQDVVKKDREVFLVQQQVEIENYKQELQTTARKIIKEHLKLRGNLEKLVQQEVITQKELVRQLNKVTNVTQKKFVIHLQEQLGLKNIIGSKSKIK